MLNLLENFRFPGRRVRRFLALLVFDVGKPDAAEIGFGMRAPRDHCCKHGRNIACDRKRFHKRLAHDTTFQLMSRFRIVCADAKEKWSVVQTLLRRNGGSIAVGSSTSLDLYRRALVEIVKRTVPLGPGFTTVTYHPLLQTKPRQHHQC